MMHLGFLLILVLSHIAKGSRHFKIQPVFEMCSRLPTRRRSRFFWRESRDAGARRLYSLVDEEFRPVFQRRKIKTMNERSFHVGGQKEVRKWCLCLRKEVRSLCDFVDNAVDLKRSLHTTWRFRVSHSHVPKSFQVEFRFAKSRAVVSSVASVVASVLLVAT